MLGPGDYFGEIALISPAARRSATVTADTQVRCWGLTSVGVPPARAGQRHGGVGAARVARQDARRA